MAEVRLEHVKKAFGEVVVIPDINLEVEAGSFTVLVGPSGCGKSTLLRLIAGLEETTDGKIFINGVDVTDKLPSDRNISMVFQSYALYPHMTVAQNIGFSLKIAKRPREEIEEAVRRASAILQLDDYLLRKPRQLSGGQRQRVAIGRAIVRNPKVFLFDEPLSNLDASLRTQMRVEIAELHHRLSATTVYVTHDQIEAMTMADRIVVLNQGKIEQAGSPIELYKTPRTPFVATFIGSPQMNLINGAEAQKLGAELYGIRAEHLDLSTSAGRWKGSLRHVEYLGLETIAYVDTDAGSLTLRKEGDLGLAPGAEVYLTPQEANGHRFRDGIRIS